MFDHEFIEAVVLGTVQGVTEFLPVSSDGHLVITQELLTTAGIRSASGRSHLHFDVMLHLGTLGAILVVYFRDLVRLAGSARQMMLVGVASVPAAIAGLGFQDVIERTFHSPVMAGVGLLVTAGFLTLGHRASQRTSHPEVAPRTSLDQLSLLDAICIGLAQALAILPGVSRSGSTISTGLMRGVDRSAAATFSFLMAVPVIGGAILKMAKDVVEGEASIGRWDIMVVGIIVSFVVGLVSLRWLLGVLSRGGLLGFAAYCTVAGIATICWKWNG
jgi:undecaprenyl-diphosphatase